MQLGREEYARFALSVSVTKAIEQRVQPECLQCQAIVVAKRKDDDPVILLVDAAAAWREGVKFYHGNEDIWLADHVPARYIRVAGIAE